MIAIIDRGVNLYGALAYNQLKVDKDKGQILFTHGIIETPNGKYSVAQLNKSFESYLVVNRNTEKPVLHISINPDPKDVVSDEQFVQIAQEYMQHMGYGEQPFVVFKHTDLDRTHIHIVSVCLDAEGRKISDKFEKRRSMEVCREMEIKYELIPATEKKDRQNNKIFRAVDYHKGDVKSQIASVVRYLPKHYKFQTLGEYNVLLSLFNITMERVEGELHGKIKKGLVYVALNEKGERVGHAFKASLFGKIAGIAALELHLEKCNKVLKDSVVKDALKAVIGIASQSSNSEIDFKQLLAEQGINVMVRRNDSGRLYGITFIDHKSRTVWNGSRLGKEFSANMFNEYWNNSIKSEIKKLNEPRPKVSQSNYIEDLPIEEPHHLFDFLNTTKLEDGLIEGLGSLLPIGQGEDYEELDFGNKMKKKRRPKL